MDGTLNKEFWLCLFLGWLGVHRFYKKQYATGVLWLLSGGLLGLGWLFDTIRILMPMVRKTPESDQDQPAGTSGKGAGFHWTPAAAAAAAEDARTYRVSGLKKQAIETLATVNSRYNLDREALIQQELLNQKLWKYTFRPQKVELVPEPDNPQDLYAVKVILDGRHVGYIKASARAKIQKKLLNHPEQKLTAVIRGGPYKVLYEEYAGGYTLEQEDRPYFITLAVEK